jgi:two-component system, OmpR family, response regulator MtrA
MVSQRRILCVEDYPATYKLMTWILKGYQLTQAATKTDALRLVATENFDLFILDNNLPDGLGIEICAVIRFNDKKTPIVFATADESLTEAHLEMYGAQKLVRKDSGFYDDLKKTVSELIEKAGGASNGR